MNAAAPLGSHQDRLETRLVRVIFHKDGSGTVPEQDTGAAISVVGNFGHRFSAEDQHFFMKAWADHSVCHMKPIGEAGTGGVQIDGSGMFHSEMLLDPAGNRGEGVIGSRC
ncbi:hypothetical protein D3C76_1029320 [compost metagenome]